MLKNCFDTQTKTSKLIRSENDFTINEINSLTIFLFWLKKPCISNFKESSTRTRAWFSDINFLFWTEHLVRVQKKQNLWGPLSCLRYRNAWMSRKSRAPSVAYWIAEREDACYRAWCFLRDRRIERVACEPFINVRLCPKNSLRDFWRTYATNDKDFGSSHVAISLAWFDEFSIAGVWFIDSDCDETDEVCNAVIANIDDLKLLSDFIL